MSCFHSCTVHAPADEVWAVLSNFHDISWAKGVIESLDVVGALGPAEVGAQRVINGAIHETLRSLDNGAMLLEYSIDDGPGPLAKGLVEGYLGRLRVVPITSGGGTFVAWSAHWERGDAELQDFCDPIYAALMEAMRAHFG